MKDSILTVDVDVETGQRTSTLRPMPFQDVSLMITHDGLFHADEVFAIALIHVFVREIPFIRTRKLDNALIEPTIMVLDQGGKYEPKLNNFDHHQLRTDAPRATVGLIFDYLVSCGAISKDEATLLEDPIEAISQYDIHGPYEFNGFQVNALIKSINSLDLGEASFAIALNIAKSFFTSVVQYANEELPKARQIWKDGYSPAKGIKVCREFPVGWKDLKEEAWLICKDKAGLWVLHARDRQPGITTNGREAFSAGTPAFIAGYNKKEDAIDAALLSISTI